MTARSLPLLLVSLTVVAGCTPSGDDGPPAGSNPGPSSVAGAGNSPTPSGAARTIPASAFLKMPDNMQRERQKADGATAVPELCDRDLRAGDGVVASAAMMSHYQAPDAPEGSVPSGVLYQTIRSYEGDSATAFMERARDALAACKSYKTPENTVQVRTKATSGEQLTIDLVQPQLDLPGDPTGGEQTNRVVVMRLGSIVTVLYDSEYERSSSDPGLVDTFVDEAGKAIEAWR